MIPGGDNFSKAIINLWNQHLFSNVQIYFTKLEGNKLFIEINVSERPASIQFPHYWVYEKQTRTNLKKKVALVTSGRVVTENTKRNAEEAIKKFYTEKGFQSATVRIEEVQDPALPNSIILNLYMEKGHKVRIDNVSFYVQRTRIIEAKLKKQMKGTKEMTKFTLYSDTTQSPFGDESAAVGSF